MERLQVPENLKTKALKVLENSHTYLTVRGSRPQSPREYEYESIKLAVMLIRMLRPVMINLYAKAERLCFGGRFRDDRRVLNGLCGYFEEEVFLKYASACVWDALRDAASADHWYEFEKSYM